MVLDIDITSCLQNKYEILLYTYEHGVMVVIPISSTLLFQRKVFIFVCMQRLCYTCNLVMVKIARQVITRMECYASSPCVKETDLVKIMRQGELRTDESQEHLLYLVTAREHLHAQSVPANETRWGKMLKQQ